MIDQLSRCQAKWRFEKIGTEDQPGTREKLIRAARELFLSRGFEATGLAEILRAAEVKSGSLYYFFKSKEELLLAVLDWYVANLYPEVIDPVFARVSDPIERVFGILSGYREMLTMTDCRMGCPIGNLAIEMSEKSEAVRAKIALNFENWRKAVRQCLEEADDRLPKEVDRERLSSFVLTVMEGAVMQARAHRSIEPYDTAVKLLRDYFGRLMESAPRRKAESGERK